MRWDKYKDNEEVLKEDVEIIKNWLTLQPHLPQEMDDLVIGKFLTRCNSMQYTKEHIDNYFTSRHHAPEIFKNRDPMSPNIRRLHPCLQVLTLPNLTKDGSRISIFRITDTDPSHFLFEDVLKYAIMVHDFTIATESDTCQDIWIIDLEKTSLSLIPRLTLSTLRKYQHYNQCGQPLKVYQTHIINAPPMLDKLVNLMKHMMTPTSQKLIYVHRPNTTTLHDFLSRDDLPAELGGTKGSMEDLQKEQIKKLEDNRAFFLDEKKWEMDETRRPGGSAVSKMDEGSFKSLSFD